MNHLLPSAILVASVLGFGCPLSSADDAAKKPAAKEKKQKEKEKKIEWLFDGKTLKGWETTDFGTGGEVRAEKGNLVLGFGQPMTGVTWKDKKNLPKSNYEVTLEAQRVDGSDFFVGMTFPVGKEFCSLIVGGWGGGLTGLSSLNGEDASENETTVFGEFKNGKWYKVRLRVTDKRIEAWIDDEQYIQVERESYEFSVRIEVEPSRPFGFASYQSTAALRKIGLRRLTEKDLKEIEEADRKKAAEEAEE